MVAIPTSYGTGGFFYTTMLFIQGRPAVPYSFTLPKLSKTIPDIRRDGVVNFQDIEGFGVTNALPNMELHDNGYITAESKSGAAGSLWEYFTWSYDWDGYNLISYQVDIVAPEGDFNPKVIDVINLVE